VKILHKRSERGPRSASMRIVLSGVNAWSIKGDVKNIFLPPPDAQVYFATSSPSHHGRRWSGVLLLGCSIAVAASSFSSDDADFETHQAVWLYGGNHGSI
jgi:hypothetical protein